MPHANGKIFIKTIGGVTYGVSVADIQQTLGRGTSGLYLKIYFQGEFGLLPTSTSHSLERMWSLKIVIFGVMR